MTPDADTIACLAREYLNFRSPGDTIMVPIYRAGWQLIKVRVLMIGSLVVLAACLWWGLDLARTYGENEADGALAPLPARLAVGGLVALLGVALAVGMWVYGRIYVARIEADPDKKQLHLHTVGFFSNNHHVIPLVDLISVSTHGTKEQMEKMDKQDDWAFSRFLDSLFRSDHGATARVHAPWSSVRIKGWRLPLIIDKQGLVLHSRLMEALFGDHEADEDSPQDAAPPPGTP
jgi:hypothetical protein